VTEEEALVEVHHISLNRGDLNDARSGRVSPGAVLGSDFAGRVLEPAANGSGPAAGTAIVGPAQGAFARRIAAGVDALAEIPRAWTRHKRPRCR
jgi:NADPH:quinone reductase-like Zn-dependent oxidoreductase